MAGINGDEHEYTYHKDFILNLESIPNTFNIGECNLEIDDHLCLIKIDEHLFPDVWNFLEKNFIQKNDDPVDTMIPRFWKLNLMTRVYVELKQFEKAHTLNEEAITISASSNIAALANQVVLLRCFGRNKEASDRATELNEKQQSMTLEFKEQMIDAFSEQAYYHYMLGNNIGTDILDFVASLRDNAFKEHEKYLWFRMYRRHLTKKLNFKGLSKTVQLLHEIEEGNDNILKALTYIEMERIMSSSSFDIQEFQTKEIRSKDEFIELAEKLGDKNALILQLIGLQKMKKGNLKKARVFFKASFHIERNEITCYNLGLLYHLKAQSLTMKEENKQAPFPKDFNPHTADQLRLYLLMYKDFIDWSQDSRVLEALEKALYYFKQRNELLKMKTMRSIFNLALLYMRCKKYNEAIEVIDFDILGSPYKNVLVEIEACILKAIAVEAQHTGPGVSSESKESLKAAIQKSCLAAEHEVAIMSDDILLKNLQKIPTFKAFRAHKCLRGNENDNIRQFLREFGPNNELGKKMPFDPEFLEITDIRSISFLIEKKNYSKAIQKCEKIISGEIPSNIFSKVQALILKAKALELPFSDGQSILEESLESIMEALSLVYPNDKGDMFSKTQLYNILKTVPLQFSYFFITAS